MDSPKVTQKFKSLPCSKLQWLPLPTQRTLMEYLKSAFLPYVDVSRIKVATAGGDQDSNKSVPSSSPTYMPYNPEKLKDNHRGDSQSGI